MCLSKEVERHLTAAEKRIRAAKRTQTQCPLSHRPLQLVPGLNTPSNAVLLLNMGTMQVIAIHIEEAKRIEQALTGDTGNVQVAGKAVTETAEEPPTRRMHPLPGGFSGPTAVTWILPVPTT